jgi:hypothetical protein
MATNKSELEKIIGSSPVSDLEALNNILGKTSEMKDVPTQDSPGKAALKRENADLRNRNRELEALTLNQNRLVKVVISLCVALTVAGTGMWFYSRATFNRAVETAFQILHYREEKVLTAHATVLEEWINQVSKMVPEIKLIGGISEEERLIRVGTCETGIERAKELMNGFQMQIKENDRERGVATGFNYKDPFLKREIRYSEKNGGEIDIEHLKGEVRKAANLDQTMKAMREAMLSPIPLAAQVTAELEEQNAALNRLKMPGQQPLLNPWDSQ